MNETREMEFGFDATERQRESRTLTIGQAAGVPLSKSQKAFNRLVKQIAKLREQLEVRRARLDRDLETYRRVVAPVESELATLRVRIVKLLAPFLEVGSGLTKAQRRALAEVLREQLGEVSFALDDDPALQAIFEKVNGMTIEEADAAAFDVARDTMEGFLGAMGVDADLSAFRADMTSEEVEREISRLDEKFRRHGVEAQAGEAAGRKTKRDKAREERERQKEELRAKSVSSIYRGLAKAVHPDLEQDPARRREKEALMKEVTAAYKANDLHTLLRLEIEWVQQEEKRAERLPEETLRLYNELLKEQVMELEDELAELGFDPRYARLSVHGAGPYGRRDWATLARARFEIVCDGLKASLENVEAGRGLQEIREIVAAWRKRPQSMDAHF